MRYWERKKSGFYRYCEKIRTHRNYSGVMQYDESILAEIAKGADGDWWMEYLHKKDGWILQRCSSLSNAKAVVEECGK